MRSSARSAGRSRRSRSPPRACRSTRSRPSWSTPRRRTAGAAEAWELVVRTPDGQHWYDMSVDAASGAVLAQADWVDNDTYNVVAAAEREARRRRRVHDPDQPGRPDRLAVRLARHQRRGRAGVHRHPRQQRRRPPGRQRRQHPGPEPRAGRRRGQPGFQRFHVQPDAAPRSAVQNQMAAQVNLFYINNLLHDIHYQYGFTEAAGNFQVNNYGHGGIGNDPVQADAQDGSGTNNANFAHAGGRLVAAACRCTCGPDHVPEPRRRLRQRRHHPRVRARRLQPPDRRTGQLQTRLNDIQSGGMGEGWSDFYALMFLQRPTDTQNAAYPIGTYVARRALDRRGHPPQAVQLQHDDRPADVRRLRHQRDHLVRHHPQHRGSQHRRTLDVDAVGHELAADQQVRVRFEPRRPAGRRTRARPTPATSSPCGWSWTG